VSNRRAYLSTHFLSASFFAFLHMPSTNPPLHPADLRCLSLVGDALMGEITRISFLPSSLTCLHLTRVVPDPLP
jgi:hypothetical protein